MMLKLICSVVFISLVTCSPAPAPVDTYKDQYCTDPRTMRKHAAYTEWADAYSCSRHRCQPGGRNLAIYTVGCKRVEAPESAIECEEVVEDTNMQFPYCCPRLRCLVVVRGEVWTRVLGQPWESLPAAPWSHMYKMKKPPPGDTSFLPKGPERGPVYELAEPEGSGNREKVLRTGTTPIPWKDAVPRVESQGPDIVIALSTNKDKEDRNERRQKRKNMALASVSDYEEVKEREEEVQELGDVPISSNKPLQQTSEEKMLIDTLATEKPLSNPIKNHQTWTEIPPSQWDNEGEYDEPAYIQPDFPDPAERSEKKEEKPSNLQALVDAIGTRMRDIENVVQRMSEKVQQSKPEDELSNEKRQGDVQRNDNFNKFKKKDPEGDDYQRFSSHAHSSKYLRAGEFTTEPPLFVEDSHLSGYYSDASNSVVRRNGPKEPALTYMAPVETRRISHTTEGTDDEKKRKKHHKRKSRKHNHKKHHATEEKKKRFSKLSSAESGKKAVSLEDSSGIQ